MTKHEFIGQLREHLSGLPSEDIENSIAYYSEMIDDRMEDGLSEAEAIAAVGPASQIAQQILMETPLPKLVKAKVKPRRSLKVWEILLLVLGSPLWLPLLAAAAATVFALYLSLWAVILSLYAVDLSLAACGAAGVLGSLYFLFGHWVTQSLFLLGAGLLSAGVGILFFFVCNAAAKYTVIGSKKVLRAVKSSVIRKEKAQ